MGEDAIDELLDYFVDGFWRVIKRRNRRHDDGAGVVNAQHVFEVDAVERCFAEAEDESAAFFQADIGGAREEVVADAVGDGAESSGGTGNHDHGVDGGAAGGDGCTDVFVGQAFEFPGGGSGEERGEFLCVGRDDAEFSGDEAQAGVGGDDVDARDARVGVEGAEDCLRVNCAARAGDAYGDGLGFGWGQVIASERWNHLQDGSCVSYVYPTPNFLGEKSP